MTAVLISSQRWLGADDERISIGADSHVGYGLMGRKDVATTMIYTRVLSRGGQGVRRPLDMDPR